MPRRLRTYNMDDTTIRILQGKPNKSDFVNLAVHKMHSKEMHFDITNVSTKQLLVCYFNRLDMDDVLRPLLLQRINEMS